MSGMGDRVCLVGLVGFLGERVQALMGRIMGGVGVRIRGLKGWWGCGPEIERMGVEWGGG